MIDALLGPLLKGALIPGFAVKQDENLNVKISIPRDHPKAAKLLALAEELATRQVLPSGIVVDYSPKPTPVYDDRLMKLLRDIVDVDEILAEAARRHKLAQSAKIQESVIGTVSDPDTALSASAQVLKSAHESLPVSPTEKQFMDNLLREKGAL